MDRQPVSDKWSKFTFDEQLGNIGSEVERAFQSHGKDQQRFRGAVERARELFELSLNDVRWTSEQHETVARLSQAFDTAIISGSDDIAKIVKELYPYAVAARREEI